MSIKASKLWQKRVEGRFSEVYLLVRQPNPISGLDVVLEYKVF